ncbi:uncharacterized protein isoform X3 [Rhodnius prolixus]|uniref:uncharacterized protein isoform X3 n=1 Tax=Rhodnius prolixus TaxID=13249 RepID=UPI003D18E4FD
MECITISSDDDEIQVLTVKLVQTPVKVKSNNSPSSSFEDEEEGSKSSVQWIKVEKSQLNDSSTDKNKFLSNNNLVPVITLEDDGVTNIEKDSENLNEQEDGNLSNKPLVKKLIELCRRVEYGAEMTVVERKIWKYYNAALPSKTQSRDLKIFLESCISKIENILSSTKDKFLISRIIKEFINELKNDPNVVDDKLRKLYFVYNKLVRRITKLEETEVESDDDGGNPYIYLDRYRKKAVEVYNKICELEGRSSDADRPTLQRFFFTGSSAPIPVQRALERYYNKTHIFPDSYDVRKLVKKVNKEENLSLSESEVQKTAQNVFMEFGERLVKRRKYDDYNILVDYLEEQCEDPADFDMELQMKLEQNKRTRKKEQDVLDNFALMEASSGKKDDDKADNKSEEKKHVVEPEEISSICLSSSSSSLASSPVNVNTEESEDSDEEDDESIRQKNHVKAIFSDSEEEFTILEAEDKKRRSELSVLTPKRLKTDVTNLKENGPNSEDDSSKQEVMFCD